MTEVVTLGKLLSLSLSHFFFRLVEGVYFVLLATFSKQGRVSSWRSLSQVSLSFGSIWHSQRATKCCQLFCNKYLCTLNVES